MLESWRQQRSSPVRQLMRFCCCCIIICVTVATIASSAPTAEAEKSVHQEVDKTPATDNDEVPNDVELPPHISPSDVTSGLAMLPKMKPVADETDENSDMPEKYEDYEYAEYEFAEPQVDNFDAELLERFLKMLDDSDYVNYDIPLPVDSARPQNSSSEDDSSVEKELEMTSSAHDRSKRSTDDHVTMTAENMIVAGDSAAANKPTRLKRDLNGYLYNRRWINADDYESPVEGSLPAGRFEEDFTEPGTFADEDYDEQYPVSEAQLKRYMDLLRAVEEMKELDGGQPYVPVIYRGVKGIFVPATSVSKKYVGPYQTADWRQSLTPFTADEVESAADKWSMLVREEVKKALDEYDLVYRLADELKKRGI